MAQNMVHINDVIREALAYDMERICTVEVTERFWNGLYTKLEKRKIMTSMEIAAWRKHNEEMGAKE